MQGDRPVLGILLMGAFCILAPMGDALAKLLGESLPLGQLLLVRFGLQALLLVPLVGLARLPWRMSGRVLRLAALRTLLHILGIGMMFTALQYLPLADAVAIAFVLPFINLLLGNLVLGEEVGPRRLIACTVGFIGTLLVIQPSFSEVGWPALWPLGVAVNFSVFMLITRMIAKETDPVGLQAVNGVMATVLLTPVLLVTHRIGLPNFTFQAPDAGEWALLFGIGAVGTLAHLMMTWSLRYAPGATLAPMQYLEIPIATILGLVIFQDLPNGLAALGIVITIGAGLYVLFREQAIARAQLSAPLASRPAPPVAE
ncbi:DMT family transporter [Mesobacterium pallidum]|uniref:DMT family transporter n=1 Tax=Mesobacterium pallidum TaxID=2872037 RepID=UPI001EE30C3A|nr:DMT family transporter [Mesobacterium pallidum]